VFGARSTRRSGLGRADFTKENIMDRDSPQLFDDPEENADDESMFCGCGQFWDEEEFASNRCKSCGLAIDVPPDLAPNVSSAP